MEPSKAAVVRDWPTPTALKEVQVFIGFANFYWRFIKDFTSIACPLHDLTKKDVPWRCEVAQQEALTC